MTKLTFDRAAYLLANNVYDEPHRVRELAETISAQMQLGLTKNFNDLPGAKEHWLDDTTYDGAAHFVQDEAAQQAIVNHIIELTDEAASTGLPVEDWLHLRDADRLDEVLADLGGIYDDAIPEIMGDWPADRQLRNLIEEFCTEFVDEIVGTTRDTYSAAVKGAQNLDDLLKALNKADEYAKRQELDRESLYDATSLPIFGGDEPRDTANIYSWDQTHLLTFGSCWSLVDREAR